MESRHMDVLEMDAASHTGVDDVRQINDSVRYAPASARYKVYIIDEVHMLSTAAFNAFLKTLEEPPEHAKFVFATTEIRKVPVTVLSRCQRFDLRRVEADVLMAHLANIAAKENVEVGAGGARHHRAGGRRLGARFAVAVRPGDRACRRPGARRRCPADAGSCRPHPGHRPVRTPGARRHRRAPSREFREQYDTGADPVVVLSDLAEFVNFVTRVKVVPATADNVAFGETERLRARDFAAKLSMRVLSRMWQMLLKGITEVQARDAAGGGGRNGAGAHRLCRRHADAGRSDPDDRAERRCIARDRGKRAAFGRGAPAVGLAGVLDAISPARAVFRAARRRRRRRPSADGRAGSGCAAGADGAADLRAFRNWWRSPARSAIC